MPTEQEDFWRGEFGDAYLERNRIEWRLRLPFWRNILNLTEARSILEVGCNAGWNLRALQMAAPTITLKGADINKIALAEAKRADLDVEERSAVEIGALWPAAFDLTFTAGVLIHIPPEQLLPAMRSILASSRRYVLAIEYTAPKEEEIIYRGYRNRLWKRPYGRLYHEALDLLPIASGALGSSDGFDNAVWWLLRRGE